ncbi:fumarate hydratase [Actinomadura madurae]|nr:fumarate hydratase [Actinomadura madurae]MCP9951345.1 fumarate hydratase [Actinomadura madurae]MCP9968119.1 fumarate hydratase [Actinomadura madurae]MCP9980578.1 fumarate hydratase [Actinomadura madurae]
MGPGTVRLGTDQLYDDLREVSAALYKKALTDLPPDVRHSVDAAHRREDGGARRRLEVMVKAIETSDETGIIVCQDTGICVFFVEIGTEAPVNGARMTEALRQGVALASERHSLRSSIVHPLTRENRQDNTGDGVPAVHVDFADGGDGLDILLIPKGSGSENMSFLSMLSPADGQAGVKKYILDRVVEAARAPARPRSSASASAAPPTSAPRSPRRRPCVPSGSRTPSRRSPSSSARCWTPSTPPGSGRRAWAAPRPPSPSTSSTPGRTSR